MKVTGKLPNPTQTAEAAKSSKSSGADAIENAANKSKLGAASMDSLGTSSRVDLSSRAQDMAKAKELATPSDGIDESKVARLQKMIDEGSYKVDADAIADRMLDEHMKMPQ